MSQSLFSPFIATQYPIYRFFGCKNTAFITCFAFLFFAFLGMSRPARQPASRIAKWRYRQHSLSQGAIQYKRQSSNTNEHSFVWLAYISHNCLSIIAAYARSRCGITIPSTLRQLISGGDGHPRSNSKSGWG